MVHNHINVEIYVKDHGLQFPVKVLTGVNAQIHLVQDAPAGDAGAILGITPGFGPILSRLAAIQLPLGRLLFA